MPNTYLNTLHALVISAISYLYSYPHFEDEKTDA